AQMGPQGAAYAEAFSEGGGAANSLTPAAVVDLPGPIRDVVLSSYNDGLTPVFLLMVPLTLFVLLLLLPVREDKLKATSDQTQRHRRSFRSRSSEVAEAELERLEPGAIALGRPAPTGDWVLRSPRQFSAEYPGPVPLGLLFPAD